MSFSIFMYNRLWQYAIWIVALVCLSLPSCEKKGETFCSPGSPGFPNIKYFINNSSGLDMQIMLYHRLDDLRLIKAFYLENEAQTLFHKSPEYYPFVGDSLVFLFEDQKKIIFVCRGEYSNLIGTGAAVCHSIPEVFYTKNALAGYSYDYDDYCNGDRYYTVTEDDYEMAE